MAHNININSLGKPSFFAARQPAWHGLGTITKDAVTSKEAIKLAQLDYEVGTGQLFGAFPLKGERLRDDIIIGKFKEMSANNNRIFEGFKGIEIPNRNFTYRKDTLKYLKGIVSDQYQVIQNWEAFEFMDSLVQSKEAMYETAGALGGGEIVFITCKLPGAILVDQDQVDKYLLLRLTHDGTGSTKVIFTPVRVVCNNTLTMALSYAKTSISIRHSANYQTRMNEAKRLLTTGHKSFEMYEVLFEKMSKVRIDDKTAQRAIYKVYSSKEEWEYLKKGAKVQDVISTRKLNVIKDVYKTYQQGVGQGKIVGTGYGLFNGITNYYQNVKTYSSSEKQFDTIFKNDVNKYSDKIVQYALQPDLVNA